MKYWKYSKRFYGYVTLFLVANIYIANKQNSDSTAWRNPSQLRLTFYTLIVDFASMFIGTYMCLRYDILVNNWLNWTGDEYPEITALAICGEFEKTIYLCNTEGNNTNHSEIESLSNCSSFGIMKWIRASVGMRRLLKTCLNPNTNNNVHIAWLLKGDRDC